jgi:eukaryotic-like serine/threonine-protein kinase
VASPAPDRLPQLSKYDVGEQIGIGGMATVYRAVDRRLGREVALKFIHPHLRGNAEVAARFVSEARAVAKLKHRNIVEVYDISDETDEERFLVVELIDGPTLRQLLDEGGSLPPEVAAALGIELAAALGAAHAQHIIHRDVKPENVLLELPRSVSTPDARNEPTRTAVVKLTDFGIAKLLDAHGVTSTGQVLGSPAHMAPEQIEGGPVGPEADVFGLGVLLYEAIVGKLPFDGANPAQVLRRVLDGDHDSAVTVRPEIGAFYSSLLDRALAREASARFRSAEDFGCALRTHLAELGIDDPRAELTAYLDDPEGYAAEHAPRIAGALGRVGQRAREAGDVVFASGCFNRALSYRPGDPNLLAMVSSVARREALSRGLRFGGGGLLALSLAGVGLWAIQRPPNPAELGSSEASPGPSVADPPHGRSGSGVSSVAPSPSAPEVPSGASAPREPVAEASEAAERPGEGAAPSVSPRPVRRRVPTVGHRLTERPPRSVRVIVSGAKGGRLLINGEPKPDWLRNQVTELTPGSHTFEFELSDPQCCKAPKVTRMIAPGDTEEVVRLTVVYRDARLEVSGPSGTLSCPALFGGALTVPGKRSVEMINNVEERELCSYVPIDSGASRPSSRWVTLRAGTTTQVTVP